MSKVITLLILLKLNLLCSQLLTSTTSNLNHLITHYLDNSNSVYNVNYIGYSNAIGSYDAVNTNLGLKKGIILTTGTVYGNDGPQGPNDDEGSGIDNGYFGSGLLSSQIQGSATFNAATLEFDFVAVSDSFFIDYIFGSEEYLEYVGTEFKDLLGIFISGDGIVGNKNIAKLPNGDIISINTINEQENSSYFISNGDGNNIPYNLDSNYIQYDGYTKVLRASSPLILGSVYHIEIIIADVSDGLFDSGVFLSSNCFGYTGLNEEKETKNITMFPNPTVGIIYMNDMDLSEVNSIELVDQLGKKVGDFEIQNNLDLHEYKNGLYTLRLTTKNSIKQELIQLMK